MKWPWSKDKNDLELRPEEKSRLDEFDHRLTIVEERVKAMRAEVQKEKGLPGHV